MPSDYLASAELFDPAASPPGPTYPVPVPPGAVRDLVARAESVSRITLAFSAPGSPPARAYVVKQSTSRIAGEASFSGARSLCGGVCRFGPATTGQRLSLRVGDLRPRTRYFYALRPLDGAGNPGPLSNVASATTRSRRPGRVRGLRARAISRTRIRLSFRATGAPPASRYVIKQATRRITSDRRFHRAKSLCGRTCRFDAEREGERLRLTVTGLAPGKRYCYAVRARDGRRLAPRSKSACARTRKPRSRR
jgi:hypothetical protein